MEVLSIGSGLRKTDQPVTIVAFDDKQMTEPAVIFLK